MLKATGLPTASLPFLKDLRDQLGYTVSLAVLDGDEIVYVSRAYSHGRGQYEADAGRRIGSRVPASCTAMGKVLLACLSDGEERVWVDTNTLRPAGPNAIVKMSLFQAELERIRGQGFAVNNKELVADMVAVSAPVYAGERKSVAIAVAANANMISAAELATSSRNQLLITASDLSSHIDHSAWMGWRR